jgi:hypothetical protein
MSLHCNPRKFRPQVTLELAGHRFPEIEIRGMFFVLGSKKAGLYPAPQASTFRGTRFIPSQSKVDFSSRCRLRTIRRLVLSTLRARFKANFQP